MYAIDYHNHTLIGALFFLFWCMKTNEKPKKMAKVESYVILLILVAEWPINR